LTGLWWWTNSLCRIVAGIVVGRIVAGIVISRIGVIIGIGRIGIGRIGIGRVGIVRILWASTVEGANSSNPREATTRAREVQRVRMMLSLGRNRGFLTSRSSWPG
jgi:hypothetical protein